MIESSPHREVENLLDAVPHEDLAPLDDSHELPDKYNLDYDDCSSDELPEEVQEEI